MYNFSSNMLKILFHVITDLYTATASETSRSQTPSPWHRGHGGKPVRWWWWGFNQGWVQPQQTDSAGDRGRKSKWIQPQQTQSGQVYLNLEIGVLYILSALICCEIGQETFYTSISVLITYTCISYYLQKLFYLPCEGTVFLLELIC